MQGLDFHLLSVSNSKPAILSEVIPVVQTKRRIVLNRSLIM